MLKLFNFHTETKEKELFRVVTPRNTYLQFEIAENINKYNYLFIQIILCQFLSTGSHISIENEIGEVIYETDIISSNNFIVDIADLINNSLIINAIISNIQFRMKFLPPFYFIFSIYIILKFFIIFKQKIYKI